MITGDIITVPRKGEPPMPKLDLTGYIPDNSEKYISNRTNKKGVILDFMSNRVRFDAASKALHLYVDERIAYDYELEESESGVHPGQEGLYYENDTDGLYNSLKDLEKRFNIDFYNTPFVENQREESFADNAGKNAGKKLSILRKRAERRESYTFPRSGNAGFHLLRYKEESVRA